MAESLTRIAVLKRFFCEPGTSLKDFLLEVRELSGDEKEDLATLAAVELGVEIKR